MKKSIRYSTSFILFTMLLLGCNSDDEYNAPQTTKEEIRFEIAFADNPKTKVSTATDFSSTWEDGDEIGIFAVKYGVSLAPSGNSLHNVKLKYNKTQDKWEGDTYWPNDENKYENLDFYAYYPYDIDMNNPNSYIFNIPIDQASNSGQYYKKNDFLWAKVENIQKDDNAVTLQFSHALAMIEIAIVKDDSTPPSVNLLETVTNCTINLTNQKITAGSTKNTIQMWSSIIDHSGNYSFFSWALVPPQTMHIRFAWIKDNIPYTVTPENNVTLTSGNIKRYTTTQP